MSNLILGNQNKKNKIKQNQRVSFPIVRQFLRLWKRNARSHRKFFNRLVIIPNARETLVYNLRQSQDKSKILNNNRHLPFQTSSTYLSGRRKKIRNQPRKPNNIPFIKGNYKTSFFKHFFSGPF